MRLPIFSTSEQAVALAQQHQDLFYLTAFKIQIWVGDLLTQAMAEYTDKPDPADRAMQTGQAWRAFESDLGRVCDEEFHLVVQWLTRYAESQNPIATNLRAALVLVYREHERSGDFLGPESLGGSHHLRPDATLLRRSVERVCDWLDSVVHIGTHILWVHEPALFDPDPEKRRRASEEVIQPVVAEMDEPALVTPYSRPPSQAQHQPAAAPPSPPSPTRAAKRPWPFAKLDESIITLWPLLKLHHWTYADLWNVLNHAGIPLAPAPCANHRQLAEYCFHTLGLRKSGHGQTTRNALPPGHPLALRLLTHFQRRSRTLGRGPYS
jgi:hypothetical protein